MLDILFKLMEAKTIREIDDIFCENVDVISQDSFLTHCVYQAKRRIEMIEKTKKETEFLQETRFLAVS